MKFHGDYKDLQNAIENASINGEWKECDNGQKQFKCRIGGNFSWWETTGTISFGGKKDEKEALESKVKTALDTMPDNFVANTNRPNKKVFVVYGHDTTSRTQLDAMLRRWGLEPLILDELPSKGQTIIEKLEEYTSDVGFGVILATPDDEGHKTGSPDEKMYRVRQNVVLELGMLLTKLGRKNVAILLKNQDQIEKPSDIQGLIYIPFKDDIRKDAGTSLAKEMRECGYDIDVKDL